MSPLQLHRIYTIAFNDEHVSIVAYGKDRDGSPILEDWKFSKSEVIYQNFNDGELVIECHGCLMDHRFTLTMHDVN